MCPLSAPSHAQICAAAVSRAYSCLSDPNQRAHYDRYGREESQMSRRGPGAAANPQGFDPDELFNMFFGSGFQGGAG